MQIILLDFFLNIKERISQIHFVKLKNSKISALFPKIQPFENLISRQLYFEFFDAFDESFVYKEVDMSCITVLKGENDCPP